MIGHFDFSTLDLKTSRLRLCSVLLQINRYDASSIRARAGRKKWCLAGGLNVGHKVPILRGHTLCWYVVVNAAV